MKVTKLQNKSDHGRPGHTGPDNENENDNDKNARPRLVERAWAYSAWSNSTNRERAFLSFSFSLRGLCDRAFKGPKALIHSDHSKSL